MEIKRYKCDYCGCIINPEVHFKYDELDICESCHEGCVA